MALFSEKLAYLLTFDTESGIKSLNKFGTAADRELSKAEQAQERLIATQKKVGAAMLAAAGVAGVALFKMAQGANEAQQNMEALRQVVGTVEAEDIEGWADDAAESLGLASKKAVESATSFAQLGKMTGLSGDALTTFSTELVGLGADFGAFKNLKTDQVLQDIRSAFSGSVEVMRKYGIFLDDITLKQALYRETGVKVTGTLTGQQKVIAVNAELFRQGADMIGQFGRESDQLNGQTQIMSANLQNISDDIGAGVLPHVTAMVSIFADAASILSSVDNATGGMIGSLATGVVVITAIGGAALLASSALMTMSGAAGTLGLAISYALLPVMALLLPLVVAYTATVSKNATETRNWQNAITDLARAGEDEMGKVFARGLTQAALAGGDLRDAMGDLARQQPGTVTEMLAMEDATGGLTKQLMAQGVSATDAALYINTLRTALAQEKKTIEENALAQLKNNEVRAESEAAARLQFDAQRTVADLTAEETEGLHRLSVLLQDAADGRIDFVHGTDAAADAQRELLEQLKPGTAAVDAIAKSIELAKYQLENYGETASQRAIDQAAEAAATEAATKAWREHEESIVSALEAGEEAFLNFEDAAFESGRAFIDAMNEQTIAMFEWKQNSTTIAQSTSDEFVAYLASMGEQGAIMAGKLADDEALLEEAFNAWLFQTAEASREFGRKMDGIPIAASESMDDLKVELGTGVSEAVDAGVEVASGRGPEEIGEQLARGAARGIGNKVEEVASAAAGMVRRTLAAAKEAGQIWSPSRLFAKEVGEPIAEGVAVGIEDGLPDIIAAAEGGVDEAVKAAQDRLRDATSGVGGIFSDVDKRKRRFDQIDDVRQAEKDLDAAIKSGDADAIAKARERLEDANYALLKSSSDMINGNKIAEESFRRIAKNAGLSAAEIDELVAAQKELNAAQLDDTVMGNIDKALEEQRKFQEWWKVYQEWLKQQGFEGWVPPKTGGGFVQPQGLASAGAQSTGDTFIADFGGATIVGSIPDAVADQFLKYIEDKRRRTG